LVHSRPPTDLTPSVPDRQDRNLPHATPHDDGYVGSSWLAARRGLFFAQDCTGSRIYVVCAFAHSADNGLVGVGVHGHIFGGKALHSISGSRAAVDKKWYIESLGVDGAEVATPGFSA